MEQAKQRKVVDVEKGLFLVRYATAEDETRPPKVSVSVEQRHEKRISVILHPDHSDAVLWQPGSCMVVRATGPGQFVVEVTPSYRNGSAAATVKIEPITQGKAGSRQQQDAYEPGPGLLDIDDFRILGHVAGIGDVHVGPGEWLAGPSAPSRIEGISIEWPGKPDDIDIRYSAKLARAQTASGRMMELGSFAGTRGRAMPIVGLTLEMSGQGASNCQFSAEAVFLGYPTMRVSGKRVVLAGPTGREPLVGLRVRPEAIKARPQPQPQPQQQPAPTPIHAGRSSSSRVRVFRSRTKQDQSLAS